MRQAAETQSVVFVIDDDPPMREALEGLFASVGLPVETFASASEFLRRRPSGGPSCLVLDVRLPGLSGLDLQAELAKADVHMPIVFITGHGDIPMTVKAMKAGAVEFLTKPFRDQELLDAVQRGLELDRCRKDREESESQLRARFEGLTQREQEVIARVTAGLMNKQISHELGVSEITVKVHRGKAMRKLGARSLVDLMKMAHLFVPGRRKG
jgi:FixJ family two-component response regulator